MHECTIIGGGVIGLSLAWELAGRGRSVLLVERGRLGREASWAGAGILPPARWETARHPMEQLRAWSNRLYPEWSARLLETTGIENGFRPCGGLYLARTAGEAAGLSAFAAELAADQIATERWSAAETAERFPALAAAAEELRYALWLPEEAQVRNPRHLAALAAACRAAGVEVREECEIVGFRSAGERVPEIETATGALPVDSLFLTAGAWTGGLLAQLGVQLELVPIRGQMLLFRTPEPLITCVVNEGPRYLVPRDDGRMLAGSTEEDVGFDIRTTAEGLADLQHFAHDLLPALRSAPLEASWAGLRPGTHDGYPYLGRLPRFANVLLATGHFRSGLHLSPATAELIADLHEGKPAPLDLTPFSASRG